MWLITINHLTALIHIIYFIIIIKDRVVQFIVQK